MRSVGLLLLLYGMPSMYLGPGSYQWKRVLSLTCIHVYDQLEGSGVRVVEIFDTLTRACPDHS